MPTSEMKAQLREQVEKFLIVKVEDMYRQVHRHVPATRSDSHTCIYITDGSATMKIGAQRYTIGKDEMLFVPAGQVFSFDAWDEQVFHKGYLAVFHSDLFVSKFSKAGLLSEFDFLRVWGNPRITLSKQTAGFVHHIFKRLLAEYKANGLKHTGIIRSYFIALLCEVAADYQSLSPSANTAATHITNRFRELLFANVKSMHRTTDYAAQLNVSPNHLNKTVKAVTGKSPSQWIDEAIVSEAKVLLCQSAMPVSDVAAEVGIEDQSYFARLFKKHEGVTPTIFRRMIEKS